MVGELVYDFVQNTFRQNLRKQINRVLTNRTFAECEFRSAELELPDAGRS